MLSSDMLIAWFCPFAGIRKQKQQLLFQSSTSLFRNPLSNAVDFVVALQAAAIPQQVKLSVSSSLVCQ